MHRSPDVVCARSAVVILISSPFCGWLGAASHAVEDYVNRALQDDARGVAGLGAVVFAIAVGVVIWLWLKLRVTRVVLSDLERARIIAETQLTMAARVQMSLLPQMPQERAGVSWYGAVEPAYKVGGDYYDLIPLEHDSHVRGLGGRLRKRHRRRGLRGKYPCDCAHTCCRRDRSGRARSTGQQSLSR